jgi:hypothetical protein
LKKYTGVTYVEKARVFPLPKSGKRVTRMVKKRIGSFERRLEPIFLEKKDLHPTSVAKSKLEERIRLLFKMEMTPVHPIQ